MSVSGYKHSFLGQSGNLTSKGWIIIFFFEGKLLQSKNCRTKTWKGSHGKKCFQQVLPTIFVWHFKKILAQSYCPPNKVMHNLKVRKKIHAPENWPTATLTSKKIMFHPYKAVYSTSTTCNTGNYMRKPSGYSQNCPSPSQTNVTRLKGSFCLQDSKISVGCLP